MAFFETSNGRINSIQFPTSNASKAAVLCVHGFCCDARIFNYLAQQLSEQGFNVISIDLFGHGKSDGEKGDPDFDICLDSMNEIITKLRRNRKVFILAHSIGCTYGLWYAHKFKNSLDGLILMSPYVRVKIKRRSDVEPSLPIFLSLCLRRMARPTSKVDITKVLPNYVKVGGDEIREMMQDEETNFHYSYRYLVDVLAMRNSKLAVLTDIESPLLILHGRKDRNVFPSVGEEFYKLVKSKDKRIDLLDCDHWFYHSVFYSQSSPKYSEESRMKVIKILVNWLTERQSL